MGSPETEALESVLKAFRIADVENPVGAARDATESVLKRSTRDSDICQNCGVLLPRRSQRGSPRKYCSPRCRKDAWIQMKAK